MKIKILLLIAFVFNAINIEAQKSEIEIPITIENIAKEWVFKDVYNPKLKDNEISDLKEISQGSSFLFNSDMTCSYSFIVESKGTWKIENMKIIVNSKKGETIWTIHKFSKNEITISKDDDKQRTTYKSSN